MVRFDVNAPDTEEPVAGVAGVAGTAGVAPAAHALPVVVLKRLPMAHPASVALTAQDFPVVVLKRLPTAHPASGVAGTAGVAGVAAVVVAVVVVVVVCEAEPPPLLVLPLEPPQREADGVIVTVRSAVPVYFMTDAPETQVSVVLSTAVSELSMLWSGAVTWMVDPD